MIHIRSCRNLPNKFKTKKDNDISREVDWLFVQQCNLYFTDTLFYSLTLFQSHISFADTNPCVTYRSTSSHYALRNFDTSKTDITFIPRRMIMLPLLYRIQDFPERVC